MVNGVVYVVIKPPPFREMDDVEMNHFECLGVLEVMNHNARFVNYSQVMELIADE